MAEKIAEQELKKKPSRWGRGALVVGGACLILLLWCRFCECDQCSQGAAPPLAVVPVAEPEVGDLSQELPPVGAGLAEAPQPADTGRTYEEIAPVVAPVAAAPVVVAPVEVAPLVAQRAPPPPAPKKKSAAVRKPIAAKRAAAGAAAAGAVAPAAAGAGLPDVAAAGPTPAAVPAAGRAADRFSDPNDVDLSAGLGLDARPGPRNSDQSPKLVLPCDSPSSACQSSFLKPGAPNLPPKPSPPLPF